MAEIFLNWVTPIVATLYIWFMFIGIGNNVGEVNESTRDFNILLAITTTTIFWLFWITRIIF